MTPELGLAALVVVLALSRQFERLWHWLTGDEGWVSPDRLRAMAPYECPTCGPYIRVDEDECCAMCGADAMYHGPRVE